MRTLYLALFLGMVGMSGCASKPTPPMPSEHTGMGTVRQVQTGFWNQDAITHETVSGYVKVLVPVCPNDLAYVWQGQSADISFHWNEWTGCYKIDGIQTRRAQ